MKSLMSYNAKIFGSSLLMTIAVVSCVVFQINAENESTENTNLLFAGIIHRHGARNPLDIYNTDPNKNNPIWADGAAQLTNEGKQQLFELGKWLRNRYGKLLSEIYNKDDIYVTSSETDRTIMSALANLAGLYPPKKQQQWTNEILDWQPIPVHVLNQKIDNMLLNSKPCKKYQTELQNLKQTEEFTKQLEDAKSAGDILSKTFNVSVTKIEDFENTFDILKVELEKGLPWPSAINKDVYIKAGKMALLSYESYAYTDILKPFVSGVLLNDLVTAMKDRIENAKARKMKIYSGHDTSIIPVLQVLGVYESHFPFFAASIAFELKNINETTGVSVYYRNSAENEPISLNLPQCGEFCEFSKFEEILKPYLLTDDQWERKCES